MNEPLTKDYLESLYRSPNWLGKKAIASRLTLELGRRCSLPMVNALFNQFGIKDWDSTDRGQAAKARGSSLKTTRDRVGELKLMGFDESYFNRRFIDDKASKAEVCREVNAKSGKELLTKRWITRILDYYRITPPTLKTLTREEYQTKRVITKGLPLAARAEVLGTSKDEVVNLFKSGYSVHNIMHAFGFYEQDVRKILAEVGLITTPGSRRMTADECLEEVLIPNGWTVERISKLFETANAQDIHALMKDEIKTDCPSVRLLERIIFHNGIRKTPEQVKLKQGAKSRAEKAANLERLTVIGHTPATAAALYENDKTLTWYALVDHFNSLLGPTDNPFTEKWLVKTLEPHFTEDFKKLRGVSRPENNFGEWLRSIYSSEVNQSSYGVIPKYQLDFTLPQKKLAIEFNGDYWHSDEFLLANHGMTAEAYHGLKRDLCEAVGYKLAFVWESDWHHRRSEVEAALEDFIKTGQPAPILSRLS